MPALKVLVCDYASGNARAGRPAPAPARRHQAGMLLRALLDDLGQVPGIELLACATSGRSSRRVGASVQAADAVWPLAPQAGGMLERLSRQVLHHERILLGSQPQALRVTASRLRTARLLARAGIDVVPTYAPGQPLPLSRGAWVVKPDDGADVDDTRIFPGAAAALAWIAHHAGARYVLQPFLSGKLGSLALLCHNGKAQLLGCNEHRIAVRDNQFYFLGTTVNSLPDTDGTFTRLGQAVAGALPGLWGHAAIDFVLAQHGAVVLAVHARMTASYVGLHASLGCNPAAMVFDLLGPSASMPRLRGQPVAVSVDVAAFGAT